MDSIKTYVIEQLQYIKFTRDDYQILIIASAIFGLWGLPVILGGIYHQDDIYRAISGNYDWYGLGRPIAQEASRVISGSGLVLIDVAPLTQIVSLLLLSLAATIVASFGLKYYQQRIAFTSILFFLNPFFLYNLYYRFDSIGMALGILFVAFAFSLRPLANRYYIIFSSAVLVAGLCTYQPIVNVFIALVGFELLIVAFSNRCNELLRILLLRVSSFVAAYLFYYLTVGLVVSARTERSSLLLFEDGGIIRAFDNIARFASYTFDLYAIPSFIMAMCISILIGLLFSWRNIVADGRKNIYLLLSMLAVCASLFGPLFLLSSTLVHFRTIPTAMALFALVTLFFSLRDKKLDKLALIPIFLVISLSYQIGNVYKNQRNFDDSLIYSIANEMSMLSTAYDEVIVTGVNLRPLFTKNAVAENEIIGKFVKPVTGWQLDGLLMNAGVDGIVFRWGSEKRKAISLMKKYRCANYDTLLKSDRFNIYKSKNLIHVTVGKDRSDFCV